MNASLPVPAQPDHVPDVHDGGAARPGTAWCARRRCRPGGAAVVPSGSWIGTVAAEPRGVAAAAGEAPGARHAIAAVDGDRAPRRGSGPRPARRAGRRRSPRGHGGRQVRGDHGAARGLAEAPRRARVAPGDLLDDLHEGERDRPRPRRAKRGRSSRKSPASRSAVHQGLGQPALPLGPLAQVLEERRQRAGPLERARRLAGVRLSPLRSRRSCPSPPRSRWRG